MSALACENAFACKNAADCCPSAAQSRAAELLREAGHESLVDASEGGDLDAVAQLPAEIVVLAHLMAPGAVGSAEPPITLRFRREDFTQQGPSGPIESKKTFSMRMDPLQAIVVRFEIAEAVMTQLDFCNTAPLLVENVPPEGMPLAAK